MFKRFTLLALAALTLSVPVVAHADRRDDEAGQIYLDVALHAAARSRAKAQCQAVNDEMACRELSKNQFCLWDEGKCTFHEQRANVAEAILPLGILGFTSCACGAAIIALSDRLLSLSAFGGTLFFGIGAYLINKSFEASDQSCALAKDATLLKE